jgi:demethylmenaquinone methyltransferase/2-methoxy-6-polyprenyl-1,4-benzoquinol methylase
MDKKPQEVAAMFDGVARRYDIVNDILSLGRTKAWR